MIARGHRESWEMNMESHERGWSILIFYVVSGSHGLFNGARSHCYVSEVDFLEFPQGSKTVLMLTSQAFDCLFHEDFLEFS